MSRFFWPESDPTMSNSAPESPRETATLGRILSVVAALVGLEALVLVGYDALLWLDIAQGLSKSLAMAISLAAVVLLVAVWLVFVGLRLLQNRRWSRSAAIFWQTCQLAVASASFTGRGASPAIGVALIVPSVIVIALLFTKPVLRSAREQDAR